MWVVSPGQTGHPHSLQLCASAGNPVASEEDWSRLDGHFRQIPLGPALKVGHIGASGQPILISNNLEQSRWVARPDWARRESIVSFAGQPLIYRGDILGVLAVFSRAEITPGESDWLRIFADHAAIAIANARAFDEVTQLAGYPELTDAACTTALVLDVDQVGLVRRPWDRSGRVARSSSASATGRTSLLPS